jgi:hypothetical protein
MTVEDHLRRRGIKARAEPAGNFYQVIDEVPDPPPLVSIIVPTTLRNGVTQRCLQSVLGKTRYRNFELLLLATEPDLAAGRAAFAEVLGDARVRALTYEAGAFNYSWVNNFGAAEARGSQLCFLNDDVEVIAKNPSLNVKAIIAARCGSRTLVVRGADPGLQFRVEEDRVSTVNWMKERARHAFGVFSARRSSPSGYLRRVSFRHPSPFFSAWRWSRRSASA